MCVLEQEVQDCLVQDRPIPATLGDDVCVASRGDVLLFLQRNGIDINIAEDLAQEVALRVRKGLAGFRGDSKVQTWVTHVAVNVLLTYRKKPHVDRENPEAACISAEQEAGGMGESPLDLGQRYERAGTGWRPTESLALARVEQERLEALLTPDQRVIVTLDGKGYSYQEIAQTLGLSEPQVRGRLERARKTLKQSLKGELP